MIRALILVALAWLIAGSAPQPRAQPQSQQPKVEKKIETGPRPASTQATPAPKVSSRPVLERPCEQGQDQRESDLCAQWKAADSAARAAMWAMTSTIVAALGIIGLYWQVLLTRKAVEDTGAATDAMNEANRLNMREAARNTRRTIASAKETEAALAIAARNAEAAHSQTKITERALKETRRMANVAAQQIEVSKDTAWKQLRAYVGPDAANYTLQLNEDGSGAFAASVEIENYGKTPAYNYRNTGALARRSFPLVDIPEVEPADGLPHVLFPTMKTYVSIGLPMTSTEVRAFLEGSIYFFSTFIFAYDDFEGVAHTQTVRYLSHVASPNMLRQTHTGQLTFYSGEGN